MTVESRTSAQHQQQRKDVLKQLALSARTAFPPPLLCEPIPVGLAGRDWAMEIDNTHLGRASVDRKPERHLHKDGVDVVSLVVLNST